MNPDNQGINRIIKAADASASSGHQGLQRTLGAFNLGRISLEEAARRSFNDIKILAEAGDNTAKAVVRNVLYRMYGEDTYNEMAKINLADKNQTSPEVVDQNVKKAKELTNKIITSKPVTGLLRNRMAMASLAGLGGAASGVTLANLLNQPEESV